MLRTLKFARYLTGFGWKPVILTPEQGRHSFTCDASEGDLPGVTVVRTGYFDMPTRVKGLAGMSPDLPLDQQKGIFRGKSPLSGLATRGLRLAKNVLLLPDSHIGWYSSAVKNGMEAISRYHPDIIFSTSPPVTAHLVARKLKNLTGACWVAELRDLWSDNHQAIDWPRWRESLETAVERSTLSRADGLVTVSDTFAGKLSSRIGSQGSRLAVIRNGFDPDDYGKEVSPVQAKFTIRHMGDLYGGSRDPGPLFIALANLVARGVIDPARLELDFHGLPPGSSSIKMVQEMARVAHLEHATKVSEPVSYLESLALQQSATVLLVIEVLSEKGSGVVPGKLFEHLGAGRPSLGLVPGGGEVERLLDATGGGRAFDPRYEADGIESTLAEWYEEWLRSGSVTFTGKAGVINELTRQAGAQKLAGFMEKILEIRR